jgi:hypothetical protein
MPPFGPIRRQDLVRHLRAMGFDGPHSGGQHQYMVKGIIKLRIPNPHEGDIAADLLTRILRQAGISRTEWERL